LRFWRDVLRFGTAIGISGSGAAIDRGKLSAFERSQHLESRIAPFFAASALAGIAVGSAARAKPETILSAQRFCGKGENHGLAHERREVDLVALVEAKGQILLGELPLFGGPSSGFKTK
jgi:hypothetical protein